ncbi:FluC/FEX family fluoride channel [Nocardioides mesophilus]|uniref:Fluoride-specific ion channel FluC n=1 Tax=Nocardioides mesophilus TaxID=433659 RepID=A0A7G9REV8_9ACTN|nr:CrcB family protein [Nocardioides mesophilus]QNN54133.1 CrcB family protein [Nocardioides mesophilus]
MTRPPLPAALAVVALGGAAGACIRALLLQAWPIDASGFPWATFAINVSGSFLLALLPALPAVRRRPLLPPLLGTGVLGGYTTLSTWSEQTRGLLAAGDTAVAGAYVFGTLAAALLAVVGADRLSTLAQRVRFDEEEGDL